MPPPGIAEIEARLEAEKTGGARRSMSLDKVEQPAPKPAPKPEDRIEFSRFPAEIQQMIWAEAIQKPACHTFKFQRSKEWRAMRAWYMHLWPQQSNRDTSAYRQWKSMLWNRGYGSSRKLANISFQTGFRKSMIDFQLIGLWTRNRGGWREAAAMDVATDLSILEFERGMYTPAIHWFEHSTGQMMLDYTRRQVDQLKRVAVHYKRGHKDADSPGPFQCYCPLGSQLDCLRYKACPVEQSCFLDCFANLEEFYYVVEVMKKELAWKAAYKEHAKKLAYKLKSSNDAESAPFELKRFYDMKYEYIQLCPPKYQKLLPDDLRNHKALPLEAMDEGGARECLIKVMEFYKGLRGNETFKNSLEDRKAVKFGILLAYEKE